MINVDKLIEIELSIEKPDPLHLSILRGIKDSGSLTYDEFKKSGRFISKQLFADSNKHISLHPECSEVINYLCGFYIQVLKDGSFMCYMYGDVNESDEIDKWTHTSSDLDEVESSLWMNGADKFFNG